MELLSYPEIPGRPLPGAPRQKRRCEGVLAAEASLASSKRAIREISDCGTRSSVTLCRVAMFLPGGPERRVDSLATRTLSTICT